MIKRRLKLPNQPNPNRIRVTITMDADKVQYLEQWAPREHRRTKNDLAEALLGRAIEIDQDGEKRLSEKQFSQIQKFLLLLMGEHTRDGISIAVVAKALNLDKQKLDELYKLVEAIRCAPELPPDHEWKIKKVRGYTVD